MLPPVFISHSSEDKTRADTICQRLESDGIKCWIAPRDIEPGSDWTKVALRLQPDLPDVHLAYA